MQTRSPGVVQAMLVTVMLDVPWKKAQQIEIDDDASGADLWAAVRKTYPDHAKAILSTNFSLTAGPKPVPDDSGYTLELTSSTNLRLNAKGGSETKMKEAQTVTPFSTWTGEMRKALEGTQVILYNAPNDEDSKVYAQQKYDMILKALDTKSKLPLTFIDSAFEKAAALGQLVHEFIAKEWYVAWNVEKSPNLIVARSGNVTISYVCAFLSQPELDQLTAAGAKMFESEAYGNYTLGTLKECAPKG